uniref:Putative secreted peptide n=1 Tax=Xanthomonas oryzae pv. oryzae TaxID=64187 RepID=Q5VLH4_XANOO|nr:putative secreted peptide [Xanthomonas oryzae pv. oryzae]
MRATNWSALSAGAVLVATGLAGGAASRRQADKLRVPTATANASNSKRGFTGGPCSEVRRRLERTGFQGKGQHPPRIHCGGLAAGAADQRSVVVPVHLANRSRSDA